MIKAQYNCASLLLCYIKQLAERFLNMNVTSFEVPLHCKSKQEKEKGKDCVYIHLWLYRKNKGKETDG